ncbi:hypothetical protein SSX86_020729 [Deinandra increscens subsp. villosa]|uniref:Uncharacterized protein n=1 Tax=Deinandra increscens subsp. villosa TaxID=3103831 RepID=A0AAP0CNG4_9ASTR
MLGAGLQFGRSRGGEDRFYNPSKARRNRQNQDSDVTSIDSTTSSGTVERENQAVKPSKLIPLEPPMPSPVCNLERFLESVTPSVPSQYKGLTIASDMVMLLIDITTPLIVTKNDHIVPLLISHMTISDKNNGFSACCFMCSLLKTGKRAMGGWRTCDEYQPYFVLGDLWESFKEWSAYGAGVPLVLNDSDSVVQYYVPYLSGIQLYMDPLKASAKSRQQSEDSDVDSFKDSSSDVSSDFDLPKSELSQRFDQLSLNYHHVLQEGFSSDEGESMKPQSCLSFEYLEHSQPWGREPLTDKILDLARCFPELKSVRSCDLLSSSWLSVAWYPIYRIPMGPTLKDLDACFLTFHSLHTPITGNQCEHPPVVMHPGEIDGVPKISLPVFGLASYKLKAPLWIGDKNLLLTDLLQAADSWLANLQVNHPDFLFFSCR